MKSETIYWLITILASQVGSQLRSHDDAASYLERERYRARLGPATLRPMLLDFSRRRDTPDQMQPAVLPLILHAAVLCHEPAVMIAGREVLATMPDKDSVRERLLQRCKEQNAGSLDEAGLAFVREVRARSYTEVDDADL